MQEQGKLAGIAINPDTSIASVFEMLNLCDYVMVMTVNTGFAGQKFIDFIMNKINELVQLKKEYGFKVIIDGACSPSVIKELSELGCDGFVIGTSALFKEDKDYQKLVKELRE